MHIRSYDMNYVKNLRVRIHGNFFFNDNFSNYLWRHYDGIFMHMGFVQGSSQSEIVLNGRGVKDLELSGILVS